MRPGWPATRRVSCMLLLSAVDALPLFRLMFDSSSQLRMTDFWGQPDKLLDDEEQILDKSGAAAMDGIGTTSSFEAGAALTTAGTSVTFAGLS